MTSFASIKKHAARYWLNYIHNMKMLHAENLICEFHISKFQKATFSIFVAALRNQNAECLSLSLPKEVGRLIVFYSVSYYSSSSISFSFRPNFVRTSSQ